MRSGKILRMPRSSAVLLAAALVAGGIALRLPAAGAEMYDALLPTGQKVTPAGAIVQVGRGPQDLIETPDGKAVIVANSGRETQGYSIVDVTNPESPALAHPLGQYQIAAHPNWVGLAWEGSTLYASGGIANLVRSFAWDGGAMTLTAGATISLARSQFPGPGGFVLDAARGLAKEPPSPACVFAAGIAISPDGKNLYVACQESGAVAVVDLAAARPVQIVPADSFPYEVAITPDGTGVYVSLWGRPELAVYRREPATGLLVPAGRARVGRHPTAMAMRPDGTLFVANGNDDTVSVVRTEGPAIHRPVRTISLEPYQGAPRSSTPTDLALSGDTLYVTLGGNNAVAVVDLADPPLRPELTPYVPTGWYPTAVAPSAFGKGLYVASAKGLGSGPNPDGPGPTTQIIGTLQVVADPGPEALAQYTAAVRENNSFDTDRLAEIPAGNAMYDRALGRSPKIKHVVFVVRENKTFDQVLGDLSGKCEPGDLPPPIVMPGVRGDPCLVRFGHANTPNTHEIARRWVTADEFRTPIEESFTGHMWTNAAQISDYAARVWTTEERNVAIGLADVSIPGEGYLVDQAMEAGLGFRIYGWDGNQLSVRPENLAKFAAHTSQAYPSGLQYYTRDIDRVQAFTKDVEAGLLERFSYVWIPNDHTYGGEPGARTPQAMVADNDWALGKMIEAVSSSPYWEDTVFLAVEDDPQSGNDHIDSHRTVFLAAGSWVRDGLLTHERYDFSSILSSIELIFGLRPMSQYDDKAARPLWDLFRNVSDDPDLSPYAAVKPAISPNDLNPPLDPLNQFSEDVVARSGAIDWSLVDQDEEEVQELLDLMYHGGAWRYGPGLAPKPDRAVLAAESRAHRVIEDDGEAPGRGAARAVVPLALPAKGGGARVPLGLLGAALAAGALVTGVVGRQRRGRRRSA
ncbi:MAG: bifunctional YncE family protein/alkaline phosphatase family protein [Acidobacteria bacterium]|nr:bifunctional YncE family protein/alkaline phosphatase family protein [Acidobacteriota bacterium]